MSLVSLKPIEAILFDLDGTLVHSSLNFKQIRQDISCPESEDVLAFLKTLSIEDRVVAENIIVQHELNDAHSSKMIAGAAELLARLAEGGIKTGILTRNSAEATQIKIERCGLKIEHILTREDAPAKPDPSGLLHFSEMWSLGSHQCVYVGDYIYDIQAANNANMHACFYFDRGTASQMPTYANEANFICRDYEKFEYDMKAYLASI